MSIHKLNFPTNARAGARWLVPFLAVMVAVVLFAIVMLGYPFL